MATRKPGGAKTARTETVTVRLDPELRYLAEIAARVQRRTLSSYVEWAIIESLKLVRINDELPDSFPVTVADYARNLWDVDEADRFIKLALHASDLLNYDEQILWKLIREYGYFWRGKWFDSPNGRQEWAWNVSADSIIYHRVREWWGVLKEVAAGELTEDALPKYDSERDAPEDPIPF